MKFMHAFTRIARLSLRNLIRQKRRSILLGVAIAFGMMVLTLAHSFSHGLSETVFNRVMRFLTGHIEVIAVEHGRKAPIIRDKERILAAARTLPHYKYAHESIIIYTRLIGNARADTSVIIGVEGNAERIDEAKSMNFHTVAGDLADFTNGRIAYPILLYEDKAKALNVRVGDTVKIRFQNIDGIEQSAAFTVAAFIRAVGSYQSMASLALLSDLKELMGYAPHESATIQLILSDPKKAEGDARLLRNALLPAIARIDGALSHTNVPLLGVATNHASVSNMGALFSVDSSLLTNTGLMFIPRQFAAGIAHRSRVFYTYRHAYLPISVTNDYTAYIVDAPLPFVFLNENDLYRTYCRSIPARGGHAADVPPSITENCVREWMLLPGTRDDRALKKKWRAASKSKFTGTILDVRTMYEHDIGKYYADLERALYAITWIGVIVLFFIILVGVVNTLRMSIRERTREIGTMRALGMQSVDVRNLFIYEVLFLAFFASVAGALFALLVMPLIQLISFETESAAGIILVNKHISFVPVFFGGGGMLAMGVIGAAALLIFARIRSKRMAAVMLIVCIALGFIVSAVAGSISTNGMLLLLIAVVTAYFPADKAASMSATMALSHYE